MEKEKHSRSRIKLLFPPLVFPYSPYLALPLLKAVLEREGHQVDQEDLNIGFFGRHLSFAGMDTVATTLETQVAAERGSRELSLAAHYRLSTKLVGIAEARYAQRYVDEAVAVLRDNARFGRSEDYRWAMETIDRALKALSARYFPAEFTTEGFRADYSPFSPHDAKVFAEEVGGNPFYDFYYSGGVNLSILSDYSIVGISIAFPDQVLAALTLAKIIKENNPNIIVCCGGNFLTRVKEGLQHSPWLFDWVDAVVAGEGEIPLTGLAAAAACGRPLDEVPGLILRRYGEVRTTGYVAPMKAIDLPTPDFRDLPLDQYLSPSLVLPLLTFKGCSYGKCTFCDHHVNYERLSARPGDRVAEDVRVLRERHGATHFNFVDEEMPPVHAERVASALLKTGLRDVRWMGYAIYRTEWTDETWMRLHASGCREMLFGFESASERILDLMQKPLALKVAMSTTRALNSAGIASRINIIVGFPGETEEEANRTREFFLTAPELYDVPGTLIAFHPFLLVRNAPLAKSRLGRDIAVRDEIRDAFALHYDYDVGGIASDDSRPPISASRSYSLAKSFSEELNAAYRCRGYPVTRLHRFLYICGNDRPPLTRPTQRQQAVVPESRQVAVMHTEIIVTPFGFDEGSHSIEKASSACDSYEFWMNFKSRNARIEAILRSGEPITVVAGDRRLFMWNACRDADGRIISLLNEPDFGEVPTHDLSEMS